MLHLKLQILKKPLASKQFFHQSDWFSANVKTIRSLMKKSFPADIFHRNHVSFIIYFEQIEVYLFKVNDGKTRAMCEPIQN